MYYQLLESHTFQQVQVERQPLPYGNCLSPDDDQSHINVYETMLPVQYSSRVRLQNIICLKN